MEIHHTKHHATYIQNLNILLEDTGWQEQSIEEILLHFWQLPQEIHQGVINHGGGHLNHTLFRHRLSPSGGVLQEWSLSSLLVSTFGSFDDFKAQFSATAMSVFWSGRAWLCKDKSSNLIIHKTANQNNPLMDWLTPLLGLDVREHAYYLKYQNRRAEYVQAWWEIVNREKVEELYLR